MFIVTTQTLENYGAHAESGKFADGQNYWKFKGGNDYVVAGVDRIQDAVAYVAALSTTNNLGYKEFVGKFRTYDEWLDELDDCDDEYREFIMEKTIAVNPNQPYKVAA